MFDFMIQARDFQILRGGKENIECKGNQGKNKTL